MQCLMLGDGTHDIVLLCKYFVWDDMLNLVNFLMALAFTCFTVSYRQMQAPVFEKVTQMIDITVLCQWMALLLAL